MENNKPKPFLKIQYPDYRQAGIWKESHAIKLFLYEAQKIKIFFFS